MVSVLAFLSKDPSSNSALAYSFSVEFVFEKNENKQKEAGIGPLFLKKKRITATVIKIVMTVILTSPYSIIF